MTQAVEYCEDTPVFVLATRGGRFACLAELSTGKHWAYAFTSEEKAKDFLRVLRGHGLPEDADRVFPCTLKEWFDSQAQKNLPDLTIDADPHQLLNYPLHLGIDLSKHNVQCVTRQMPGGTSFTVLLRSPSKSASSH
jgi:hypothetical protein